MRNTYAAHIQDIIGESLSEPHGSEYDSENGVCHRTYRSSHTVCSILVLAYSILLSKIVMTIGTVPTALRVRMMTILTSPAACIPQVGPVMSVIKHCQ